MGVVTASNAAQHILGRGWLPSSSSEEHAAADTGHWLCGPRATGAADSGSEGGAPLIST